MWGVFTPVTTEIMHSLDMVHYIFCGPRPRADGLLPVITIKVLVILENLMMLESLKRNYTCENLQGACDA